MLEFRTTINIPQFNKEIVHSDSLLLIGSCFIENIGKLLSESKFACNINPFGIQYNPLSIASSIKEIISDKKYEKDDLFFHKEEYHSFMHHSDFSNPNEELCLKNINSRIHSSHQELKKVKYLIITFGTSWVYTLNENERVVSNCHKLPAKTFNRKRLTVDEIVEEYTPLLQELQNINSEILFIFTVSPIRHLKDGAHGNQLSKATLLLAIDELQKRFSDQILYFPSYEIMMDDLRDYRFYTEDMLHISAKAVEYIWTKFSNSFFSEDTRQLNERIEKLNKAINHKPFNPNSEEYKRFMDKTLKDFDLLKKKYPAIKVDKEIEICRTRLKK